MRTLRTLLWSSLLLFASLPIAQAKTRYAYIANNNADNVSVVNTATGAVVGDHSRRQFPVRGGS